MLDGSRSEASSENALIGRRPIPQVVQMKKPAEGGWFVIERMGGTHAKIGIPDEALGGALAASMM